MKRVSVLVVGLVVALCVALPLAGCSANEYTPTAKDQTVNDSALNTAGTLRVGVNASNAPYSCESSGSIVGIDVDIAAALADEMGLKLELVDVGTGSDTAFTKDNVDIVMGVTKSNSAYWMSDTYLSSGVALFSLTQGAQAPTAGGGFKVAAWMGFSGEKMIAILIMLASPTTPSCYIMAKSMNNDEVLTASVIVTTTLMAAFTLTGWIFLLKTLGYIG